MENRRVPTLHISFDVLKGGMLGLDSLPSLNGSAYGWVNKECFNCCLFPCVCVAKMKC